MIQTDFVFVRLGRSSLRLDSPYRNVKGYFCKVRSLSSLAYFALQKMNRTYCCFCKIRSLLSQARLTLQKLIEACFDEQSFCPHRLEA